MKKINAGSEQLIPKSRWVPEKEIQGDEMNIIDSPVTEKAFQEILKKFKPKKKIAFVGLCSSTRPFSKSRRWKEFNKLISDRCDLIINSSGGVIPIEYSECYPFLTYDADKFKHHDTEYLNKLYHRCRVFFTKKKYDYILFNFRHNLRNVKYAFPLIVYLKNNGLIKDGAVLPTKEQYKKGQEQKFHLRGFKMFPELYPPMLNPVLKTIKEWSEQ